MSDIEVDLNELLVFQSELDCFVFKNNGNLDYSCTSRERKIALIVEFCELLNETKIFKFWSSNPNVNKSRVLEEYVDALHFLLSTLLSNKTNIPVICYREGSMISKDEALDLIVCLVNNSENCCDLTWIQGFFDFGVFLGLKWEEIRAEYFKKRQINIDRQKSNY